jgi:hypothetical protein
MGRNTEVGKPFFHFGLGVEVNWAVVEQMVVVSLENQTEDAGDLEKLEPFMQLLQGNVICGLTIEVDRGLESGVGSRQAECRGREGGFCNGRMVGLEG